MRQALIAGELLPGEPLLIGELSERFALSPTPVREALARLHGEGLVVAAAGGGYASAPLDRLVLTSLRRLERILLEDALMRPLLPLGDLAHRLGAKTQSQEAFAERTHWLLREIVQAAADGPLDHLFGAVSARLGAARRVEAATGAGELDGLARGVAQGDAAARAALDGYFHRRCGHEAETCDAIFRLRRDQDPREGQ